MDKEESASKSEFNWLNQNSRKFLKSGYLEKGLTPEKRMREIGDNAERILEIDGFSDKFYKYMKAGYYSLASPIWSNFGNKRGLPISCFGSCVEDDMGSILHTQSEVGMMSKLGGGTSAYFGKLRPRGSVIKGNGKSTGSVHMMQLFEKTVDVVSQGSVRRGRCSPYLPVNHGDIDEFLDIGTEGNPIQELNHGITVSNKWMKEMIDGDTEKRSIWAKVLQRRSEIGYPYIFFSDNANEGTVDTYKDKKIKIESSNLCTEIMLPSNKKWSFVCCLSSINLIHYDSWENTDAVETLTYFLDAVMSEFIKKMEDYRDSCSGDDRLVFHFMKKSYNFAKENRALGLGVLGWHSLLQSKMLAFNSTESYSLNRKIFKTIKEKSYKASEEMAKMFGEPKMLKGYNRRNTTLNAVAPTTSSAFILGQVSQGIEPIWSNIYVKDIAKIKTTIRNPILEDLLIARRMNTMNVWNRIKKDDGSVKNLHCLTDEEKEVFKTYSEINQYDIIYQAANRQEFIDQGQSVNLMIHPDMLIKDINAIYINAWKLGLKSLYYQHSVNAAQKFKQTKDCEVCES